ncbi:endonuclease/exonuclease/phosphatase family protein [Yeosuana sp. MJ-SS3]|uniref:Endonuclease/exonuclease/phosphatase family protein n=1 Tax=Gilvirhabdus luticola TaxID=3079858 RepID=A0ABU3U8D2_9FLAO|nr:endonuclease/exonuclease/phosphatase family protein [Yeosuana sp. MJ-SS3]MDU8886556.1 endonuclease/exonuclease/phosphatase family protein [Yeosuana sp. MJ-SS3]
MKKLSFIGKIVFFCNAIVALLLLFSYTLPLIPPRTFPILSVLSLGVPFLIILNILFFMYWFFKLKKQLFLSFVVLLIGYFCFGSLYKFSSGEDEKKPDSFSVINYNVRLFNLYKWIEEDNIEENIVGLIKTEAPDVLALQEYHPHKDVDLSFFKYKYEKLSGNKTKYGQAIFSNFPIVNSGSIEFPNTSNNAIFADIAKGKDTIRIYNVHLQSMRIDANANNFNEEESEKLLKRVANTFKMQQSQVELFQEHKKQCKYKMIVCGDLNNTSFSYAYKHIKGDFVDAFKESGSGFGRSYLFKLIPLRIDFILCDNSFEVTSFKNFNEKYSDHYPIKATFALHE